MLGGFAQLNKKIKTGGRVAYMGVCVSCGTTETCRWYRLKEEFKKAICRSCYDVKRRLDPSIRNRRLAQRRDWGIKNPYRNSKNMAKVKKLEFSLSEVTYLELTSKVCYFCGGDLPIFGIKLDRIDNTKAT